MGRWFVHMYQLLGKNVLSVLFSEQRDYDQSLQTETQNIQDLASIATCWFYQIIYFIFRGLLTSSLTACETFSTFHLVHFT